MVVTKKGLLSLLNLTNHLIAFDAYIKLIILACQLRNILYWQMEGSKLLSALGLLLDLVQVLPILLRSTYC